MKTSIDFLPQQKQQDLQELVAIIREKISDVVMIILYGSYAKNTYVLCDERRDFGVKTFYMSDYDILIVTRKRLGSGESTTFSQIKDQFLLNKDAEFYTRPQCINESISKLNNALSEGRYFYIDIQTQGIMLYDSGEYVLSKPRELNYAEIYSMAKEYYNDKFPDAVDFAYHADIAHRKGTLHMAAFFLHQAAEHFIKTIPLVYILYGYKEHDLEYLVDKCKVHTMELTKIFPRNTPEEERLFKLLQRAYIESRYNKKNFPITDEDIVAFTAKIALLQDITAKVCEEQFTYYQKKAASAQSDTSK